MAPPEKKSPPITGGDGLRRRERLVAHPLLREDLGPGGTDAGADSPGAGAEVPGHRWHHPSGRLYLKGRKGSIRGPQVIAFLKPLQRPIRRRPILIFGDNGQPPRSKLVRAFLEVNPRLEAHRLSAYRPELNPEEGVWAPRKKPELASYAPPDLKELRRGIRLAVVRMRDHPRLFLKLAGSSKLPP